ncbi:MAG: hypothetical protein QM817_36580 [Archangium sp.]
MLLPLLVASSVLAADPSVPPLVPGEPVSEPVAAPPLIVVDLPEAKPVRRSPKRALTIAGTAVFGASYGLSLGVAAITEMTARSLPVVPAATSSMTGLFVPVVGPIIAAADPRNLNAQTTALMLLDGLAQGVGLVFLIVGIALPAPEAAKAPTAWLVPTVTPGGAGAAFGGVF